MPAPKGTRPPNAGKGRPRGAANTMTRSLRDMILGALDDAGGQAYLAEQAHQNPAAFLTLLGRVLPREPIETPPAVITLDFGYRPSKTPTPLSPLSDAKPLPEYHETTSAPTRAVSLPRSGSGYRIDEPETTRLLPANRQFGFIDPV